MPPSPSNHSPFTVPGELGGKTLAAVVRIGIDPSATWSNVRKEIARGAVRVNGTLCLDDARRIRTGDVIILSGRGSAPPVKDDVGVVYLDANLVVVEKPAGMETTRRPEERDWDERRKARQPTLAEAVSERLVREARGKSGARHEVRAVHRLDRDTSGLMLFARTPAAERELVRRFACHQIQRLYLAVVDGTLETSRTIETWIVRDRGDGRRGSIFAGSPGSDAQHAVTHVRPIRRLSSGHTLVECRLETGRTHQIRIHLSEVGHPVSGDRLYAAVDPAKPSPQKSAAPRQALHSASVEFMHPITSQHLTFRSAWPPRDLKNWWAEVSREDA